METIEHLSVGTRVVVTGDSAGWSHEFAPGTHGVIAEIESAKDGQPPGYLVVNSADEWSVAECDVVETTTRDALATLLRDDPAIRCVTATGGDAYEAAAGRILAAGFRPEGD